MKFKLKIKKADIKKGRDQVLKKAQKDVEIKGFRKGKAPLDMVVKYMGEKSIIEKTLDIILPKAYADKVVKDDLKPITSPRITPTKLEPEKDWEFDVEIALRPKISLGDYKKKVKAALKKAKPETKAKKDKKEKELSPQDKKTQSVFDSLLDNIKVELSPLLIEEEVNNQLSRLSSQIQKLGLSVEEYLKTMKTDVEKLKKEYEKTAKDNLKLEFILHEISKDLKLEAEDKEIDDLLKTVGSKEVADRIRGDAREMASIKHMIVKRKTVDYLVNGDL